MGEVMLGSPSLAADIAKLIVAAAGHVVPPLVFFQSQAAIFACSVFEVLLEELEFKLITGASVLQHQAVAADTPLAAITEHNCVIRFLFLYNSFTVFIRTHLSIGVFLGQVELPHLVVALLHLHREPLKEKGASFDGDGAGWIRTGHLLKLLDAVDGVFVEALFAEAIFVGAVGYVEPCLFLGGLHTDLAFELFR